MPNLRSVLEWLVILIPLLIILVAGYTILFSAPAKVPSGLPDNGGFLQVPLDSRQVFTKQSGGWQYTLTSRYDYTAAGKVVGRHAFPTTPPDGIIALDLALANGDLLKNDNLQFFTFTMGDHTLRYSYDIPTYTGLTEEYIDEHISNNHLVFLDPVLEQEVKSVQVGDCIRISGKLVDIAGTSGGNTFSGKTSTVRNDEYPEGCEIILVESFNTASCG